MIDARPSDSRLDQMDQVDRFDLVQEIWSNSVPVDWTSWTGGGVRRSPVQLVQPSVPGPGKLSIFKLVHLVRLVPHQTRHRPAPGSAMTGSDAEVLTDLARRLERLRPSHRDPEQFHIEKSEIAAELRRLARAAERVHRGGGRGGAT